MFEAKTNIVASVRTLGLEHARPRPADIHAQGRPVGTNRWAWVLCLRLLRPTLTAHSCMQLIIGLHSGFCTKSPILLIDSFFISSINPIKQYTCAYMIMYIQNIHVLTWDYVGPCKLLHRYQLYHLSISPPAFMSIDISNSRSPIGIYPTGLLMMNETFWTD